MIAFFIAFSQNNSLNRKTTNVKKLTKAGNRNPPITPHTLFQKTVIESTFNNYYRIEAKYEYWIVHFMNRLLNQQTKSLFR